MAETSRHRLPKRAPRKGGVWAQEIFDVLDQQTVTVVGTSATGIVLPRLAKQLTELRRQRTEIAAEVEQIVEAHPLHPVLTSMPGVGVRTAARLLAEIVGKHFPTAGHLAAYAGLTPVQDVQAPQSGASHHPDVGTRS